MCSDYPPCLRDDLIMASGMRKPFALYQSRQVFGMAQQDLGQELAAGKECDQDLQSAGLVGQVLPRRLVRGALRESLQVDQDTIRPRDVR